MKILINQLIPHIPVLSTSIGFAGIGGIVGAIIGTFLDKTYTYQFSSDGGSAQPTPIGTSGQAGSGGNP